MSNPAVEIGSNATSEKPIFAAVLTPHRSLSRLGFGVLITVFAVLCISSGVFYFTLGAWPVLFFLGFDLLLLWFAFQFSYRAGKESEEIELTRTSLTVRKIKPNGRKRQHTYNPFWAKFHVNRDEDVGITDMRIVGEGYQSTLGSFMNPEDKESFANAFRKALATAKR
ncbi:MAG: DUF2244 domain-containing protein [Pseudomonadota bacterium]